jgi:hypothetical protein
MAIAIKKQEEVLPSYMGSTAIMPIKTITLVILFSPF